MLRSLCCINCFKVYFSDKGKNLFRVRCETLWLLSNWRKTEHKLCKSEKWKKKGRGKLLWVGGVFYSRNKKAIVRVFFQIIYHVSDCAQNCVYLKLTFSWLMYSCFSSLKERFMNSALARLLNLWCSEEISSTFTGNVFFTCKQKHPLSQWLWQFGHLKAQFTQNW